MIYGYARVSTAGQDLEAQLQALKAEKVDVIYHEKVSAKGSTKKRPELYKLLSAIEPGDTLIVTRLDRLARSVLEGATIIKELFDKGVRVHILNVGVLEDTTMGKLLFNMLLALAEFERSTIIERTQEGREIARQKPDYREGRPKKYTKKQMDHAMKLLEHNSFTQVADLTGISVSTLKRESGKRKKAAVK